MMSDADVLHLGSGDASFDTFIDSELILESNTPASTPGTPIKKGHKDGGNGGLNRLASLHSLPSRLSLADLGRGTPTPHAGADGMNGFLNYSSIKSESTATTPTTSNGSSLHNLSFDFFENGDGNSIPGAGDAASHDGDADMGIHTPSASPIDEAAALGLVSTSATPMDSTPTPLYGPVNNAFYNSAPPMGPHVEPLSGPMLSFQRTVDDMGHQPGHQQLSHHPAHHQRSLSLRHNGPFPPMPPLLPPSMAAVALGHGEMPFGFNSNAAMAVPAPSGVLQGADDEASAPRKEKKRRRTDSSIVEPTSTGKSATTISKAAAPSKKALAAASRRARSNTAGTGKKSEPTTPASAQPISPRSLIENSKEKVESVQSAKKKQKASKSAATDKVDEQASDDEEEGKEESVEAKENDEDDDDDDDDGDDDDDDEDDSGETADLGSPDGKKASNKKGTSQSKKQRPQPSASKITEAGMPFPVIDTSAKHSSLFVPPDTSGLTKHEARLVRNRAAAFLSRQRKREQFAEFEVKCKSLCRLVWKMWEVGRAPSGDIGPNEAEAKFRFNIVRDEDAEVKELFETILILKGGSVAPTEDGQLQGAVDAGIKSCNGKLSESATEDADRSMDVEQPPITKSMPAANHFENEIAALRSQLQQNGEREARLWAELQKERTARVEAEKEMEAMAAKPRPFKESAADFALTTPAPMEEDEDVELNAGDGAETSDIETARNKRKGRAGGNLRPSRSSQRLQRHQGPDAEDASQVNGQGNQRKAAGAALMMVLFSFALFGLPAGQTTKLGGFSYAGGSSADIPLGRVLGAPLSGASHSLEEEDDNIFFPDYSPHLPPSSHLSAQDLFPISHDDLPTAEDGADDSTQSERYGSKDVRADNGFSVDYQAFAKDLESSLDWDMRGGFIVLGPEAAVKSKNLEKQAPETSSAESEKAEDAPTKLTLFVPAPGPSDRLADAEDRFYDAPLASPSGNGVSTGEEQGEPSLGTSKELSQAEATRAALQVLRNHRVAREAAALAASRRQTKQDAHVGEDDASRVVPVKLEAKTSTTSDEMQKSLSLDGVVSEEALQASGKAADEIRGKDFYQLEFSLSGAKVRNVAELARLLGEMRTKNEQ